MENGRSGKEHWRAVFAKAMQQEQGAAFEELWQGYFARKVYAWAHRGLRGKSSNLEHDCQDVVSTIFMKLFENSWYRHLKQTEPCKLTTMSLKNLHDNGVPDSLMECLRTLENQGFPDEHALLQAVERQVPEQRLFEQYAPLIQEYMHDALAGFSAYLWTMTHNECIRAQRAQQRSVLSEEPLPWSSDGYATQPKIEHRERLELLCQAIQRITPDEERQVLEMRIFQELSLREISEKTGKPIQTLHSQYEKHLKRLRKDPKLREYWQKEVSFVEHTKPEGQHHDDA